LFWIVESISTQPSLTETATKSEEVSMTNKISISTHPYHPLPHSVKDVVTTSLNASNTPCHIPSPVMGELKGRSTRMEVDEAAYKDGGGKTQ
jgi:hypothetical protein